MLHLNEHGELLVTRDDPAFEPVILHSDSDTATTQLLDDLYTQYIESGGQPDTTLFNFPESLRKWVSLKTGDEVITYTVKVDYLPGVVRNAVVLLRRLRSSQAELDALQAGGIDNYWAQAHTNAVATGSPKLRQRMIRQQNNGVQDDPEELAQILQSEIHSAQLAKGVLRVIGQRYPQLLVELVEEPTGD